MTPHDRAWAEQIVSLFQDRGYGAWRLAGDGRAAADGTPDILALSEQGGFGYAVIATGADGDHTYVDSPRLLGLYDAKKMIRRYDIIPVVSVLFHGSPDRGSEPVARHFFANLMDGVVLRFSRDGSEAASTDGSTYVPLTAQPVTMPWDGESEASD